MTADPHRLRQAADLLDQDDVFDIAAGAIAEMPAAKREAGDCINAVIDALRTEADAST